MPVTHENPLVRFLRREQYECRFDSLRTSALRNTAAETYVQDLTVGRALVKLADLQFGDDWKKRSFSRVVKTIRTELVAEEFTVSSPCGKPGIQLVACDISSRIIQLARGQLAAST